ncbi:SBBP repeat-containing protein [Pyxidicoccus sp. 3LFB2]
MALIQRWWFTLGILSCGTSCQPEATPEGRDVSGMQTEEAAECGGQFTVPDEFFQFGTSDQDRATAVSVDSSGAIYLTGTTRGLIGEPGEQGGSQDAFVAKLNASMQFQWVHQVGSSGDDTTWDVTTSAAGDTYVVGLTPGAMPGQGSRGQSDFFAIKYNTSGGRDWLVQGGSAEEDYGQSIALAPNNRLRIAGSTLADPSMGFDAVVYEVDASNGHILEDVAFGSTSGAGERGEGVAVAADGRTWVVGSTLGNLGGTPSGSTDAFIRELDANLNEVWTYKRGTADIDAALEVVSAGSNGTYILALSYSNLVDGGRENDGIANAFLMRFNTQRELRWVRRIGASNYPTSATGLAVDANGNAYVAGWTSGALPNAQHQGGTDAFVVRFDRSGNMNRTWQWGTAADDEVRDVVLVGTNTAVAVGTTAGDLGAPNQGSQDVFVVKFATDS